MNSSKDKQGQQLTATEFDELVGHLDLNVAADDGHAAAALRLAWEKVRDEYESRIESLQRALPKMTAPAKVGPWTKFELHYGGYVYVKRSHAVRAIEAAKASASSSCPPAKVRFTYCDEVSERNIDNAWKSGLANIGDARLVWVNEGDILQHGELIENKGGHRPHPPKLAQASAVPECGQINAAGPETVGGSIAKPSGPEDFATSPAAPTPRTAEAIAKFRRRTYSGACVCVDAEDMAQLERELAWGKKQSASSAITPSEERLKEALRPAIHRIVDHLDELTTNDSLQILVDALRDLDAPRSATEERKD